MFGWLNNSNRKIFFSDHFAFSQTALDQTICEAARFQADQGDLVFLLAHFPETFERIQNMLESHEVDYGIATEPIDWAANLVLIRSKLSKISLSLTESFQHALITTEPQSNRELKLSIIVVERHPLISMDESLKAFVRKIPFHVKLGYYLAFDQPVVDYAVEKGLRLLMKQFGMTNHSLVTSELISRRIRRKLKIYQRTHLNCVPADSPQEWYELNGR